MAWVIETCRELDSAAARAARVSQAAVIQLLDHMVGGPRVESSRRSPLARLLNFHLECMDLCLGDTASVTHQVYDGTIRLVSLHREFLQRVLEAVDTRDATLFLADREPLASVVDLHASALTRRP